MSNQKKFLCLTTAVAFILGSTVDATPPRATSTNYKTPWNGFFVGGLLGGKFIGGKGSITTFVNAKDETVKKDDIIFPLPSHTLNVGFNSEFSQCSTIAFGADFDYGVLPTLKLSLGYLITPLDRISVGFGWNVLLLSAAFSSNKEIEVSSLYGFSPSISYERSIGSGAFFQAQVNYGYLAVNGDNLSKDYKTPVPVKRFVHDYWNKDVENLKSVDASAHGLALSLGFGYTF